MLSTENGFRPKEAEFLAALKKWKRSIRGSDGRFAAKITAGIGQSLLALVAVGEEQLGMGAIAVPTELDFNYRQNLSRAEISLLASSDRLNVNALGIGSSHGVAGEFVWSSYSQGINRFLVFSRFQASGWQLSADAGMSRPANRALSAEKLSVAFAASFAGLKVEPLKIS
jgi:hypothetical protein